MKLIIIKPNTGELARGRLKLLLRHSLQLLTEEGIDCEFVYCESHDQLQDMLIRDELKNTRILFAIQLGESGMNLEYCVMESMLRLNAGCMENSVGGILIDGETELYTKATARELVFTMNQCGCLMPGKPAVEGTGSLKNFVIRAKNQQETLLEAYFRAGYELICRVLSTPLPAREKYLLWEKQIALNKIIPADQQQIMLTAGDRDDGNTSLSTKKKKLLCLHASEHSTSNTLQLWGKVRTYLEPYLDIQEVQLRNGEIRDCGGCPFNMCMHFSNKKSCYYGGTIVEEVYPAVEECDAMIMLCPNYNDAISANISAFINRLTALFRNHPFYEKYLFAIVVSGYSGSDIVASQLIDSLNMNKTFCLPPNFAMLETANDPGSIDKVKGITDRAEMFAARILTTLE